VRVAASFPALARAGLLALFLIPVSCALGPSAEAQRPVRSLAEIRFQRVVMQRWDLSCGAAALATLLTYDLGDPVTERAVAEGMLRRTDPLKVRVQGGFSLLDLYEYAEGRGYEPNGYGELSFEHLQELVPAVLPVRLHGYDHFVVFRGTRRGRVVFADPAFGNRTMPIAEFERAWKQRVAFVVARSEPEPDARSDADSGGGSEEPKSDTELYEKRPSTKKLHADDEETTRALERALVRRGALVLRQWSVELEPGASYRYNEPSIGRRDTFGSSVTLRLGLPWAAQIDVRVPFVLHDRQSGVGTGSGLGDIDVGLTKLLLRERAFVPELLFTGRWKTTTGASGGPLSVGSGANGLQGLLTALKRDDPLVLFGSAYYVWNMPSGDVDLGDTTGLVLGLILAATPGTSVLLDVDVASISATTLRGRRVAKTDRLSGILEIALSTIVGRDLLLNFTVGIGVTPSAPDLHLAVALPFRM
jgi:predicted double-glycine peptidase